jgi:PAS domain S-box-containing protein
MLETTHETTLCADDALHVTQELAEAIHYEGDETYRVMADAMAQIIWSGNTRGSRDYFNQRWMEHTGLSAAQTKGWGWLTALHTDDASSCRKEWTIAAQGSEPFECEYRLYCAHDGSYRWHIERVLPVFDPEGQVVKWFGTCTDIHALKEAQAEIDALNFRLRRAMQETHHRVKNNLQIISSMIDMQLMNDITMISAEEFQRLGTHVRTLASVHDLLTQEAKAEEPHQAISIEDVLAKLLPVHQETARHCRIAAQIEDVQLPGRQGTSLALVVNELISNAIKHGKGKVEIVVAQEGSQTTVTVCDDGPGFPVDFDPKKAANTGLELIRTLVQWDLAGKVQFGNQPEGGAQVTVSFANAETSVHQEKDNPINL